MIPHLTNTPGLDPVVLRWLTELRKAPFVGDIDTRLATRIAVATDNSIYEILPQAVVFPKTPTDVVTIMQTLNTPAARAIQIVPRGAGTGTNGQALAPGVVVDLSRHMRAIGPVNTTRSTVHVEPGVVLDDLNRSVFAHGLFFAPTLSPSDRATLGGMIGTNACGKGSRIYGRTVDHVVEVDLVLVDGTAVTLREMDIEQARHEAQRPDLLGRVYRTVLDIVTSRATEISDFGPQCRAVRVDTTCGKCSQ